MNPPFFHDDSDCVRFWVPIAGIAVGASVRRDVLHHRYAPHSVDEDPLTTFQTNRGAIEDAVRRRVANGSIEPVMVREFDLKPEPAGS